MATKLTDVNVANQSEAAIQDSYSNVLLHQGGLEDINSGDVKQSHIVFKLVRKKRGATNIPNICNNVLNPKTGKRDRIHLLIGAPSIWQADIMDLLKDKSYVSKNRYSLRFENGVDRIPIVNETELEFARVCPFNVGKNRNGSGKFDFFEYDPVEENAARYERQMLKIKTIQLVSNMEAGKMTRLALFLGIKPTDDELGLPKGEEGMRTELLLKAEMQPEVVNKFIDSKEVEVSYLVRKAIVEAKIDLSNNGAMWASGKGFIGKIPSTRKPLEYLTELALTNSNEGRQFKQQLEAIAT